MQQILGASYSISKCKSKSLFERCGVVRHTEDLTANHSGAPCWGKCHVSRTLKNFAAGLAKSRTRRIPCRRLNCPTSNLFYCGSQNSQPRLALCPFFIHFIIISCSLHHPFHVHSPEIAEIALLGSNAITN